MRIHPLADTYPLHDDEELASLVEDIKTNGLREPIVISKDDVLLDGRNRLRACKVAGVRPRYRRKEFLGDSPEASAFVDSANLRRSMTTDQEIMRRVMHSLPETYAIKGHSKMNYDKARAVFEKDTDKARVVLSGKLTIIQAHNDLFPKPRKPRKPREKSEQPVATIEDKLGATRAKEEARQAKRDAKELMKELEKAREVASALTVLTSQPLPEVQRVELGSGLREATAVALASDWHVEEMVTPNADTAGNAYNLEIANLRARRFFSAVEWSIKHAQSAFKIRNLVLWLGGDLTTGQLHEENLETGQLQPLEAMLWVQDRIASGIRYLLASDVGLERLDVICSYGNHGRFTKRMRAGTGAGHNSDWLMYQTLASMFAEEERVNFQADKAEHQFHTVYDKKLHFHHGHRVNYGGGVGGITIPLNKASAQWDKVRNCDYHHYGHFHQYIDTGSTLVNGSLIGFNAYAMSIKATPEVPQQAFYLLDSKRGKSTRTPLWVSDPSGERKLWEERWLK
jgi:hypothetical protein